MNPYTIVRILTTASLATLLFEIGLRLKAQQVWDAARDWRLLVRLLVANFVAVPALALGLIQCFGLDRDPAVGMLLLAAAPFAPVVPIFTKLARGDLAQAASLTMLFPVFSAFLTPPVCALGLRAVPGGGALRFSVLLILAVLLATITLPLVVGVGVNHVWPRLSRRLQRPIEVVGDAAGAISLLFVTAVEWPAILQTGWKPLLAMAMMGELTMILGYALGGPNPASRRVTAFGTSNRNIALAILVALGGLGGTAVLSAVVACGLLLIFLGLVHVAGWRVADALRGGSPCA